MSLNLELLKRYNIEPLNDFCADDSDSDRENLDSDELDESTFQTKNDFDVSRFRKKLEMKDAQIKHLEKQLATKEDTISRIMKKERSFKIRLQKKDQVLTGFEKRIQKLKEINKIQKEKIEMNAPTYDEFLRRAIKTVGKLRIIDRESYQDLKETDKCELGLKQIVEMQIFTLTSEITAKLSIISKEEDKLLRKNAFLEADNSKLKRNSKTLKEQQIQIETLSEQLHQKNLHIERNKENMMVFQEFKDKARFFQRENKELRTDMEKFTEVKRLYESSRLTALQLEQNNTNLQREYDKTRTSLTKELQEIRERMAKDNEVRNEVVRKMESKLRESDCELKKKTFDVRELEKKLTGLEFELNSIKSSNEILDFKAQTSRFAEEKLNGELLKLSSQNEKLSKKNEILTQEYFALKTRESKFLDTERLLKASKVQISKPKAMYLKEINELRVLNKKNRETIILLRNELNDVLSNLNVLPD